MSQNGEKDAKFVKFEPFSDAEDNLSDYEEDEYEVEGLVIIQRSFGNE